MNQFSLLPVVSVDRGRPVASSLDVASYFGKRHDHVLRDIRGLLRTEPNGKGGLPKSGESLKSFARSNFVLGTYRNVQNKEHPILNPILDSVPTRIRLTEASHAVS